MKSYLIPKDRFKKLSNSSFILWSLGVDMADFLASGHSVPSTASSEVKKYVCQSVAQKNVAKDVLDNLLNRLSALSNPGTLGPDFCLIRQKLKILV